MAMMMRNKGKVSRKSLKYVILSRTDSSQEGLSGIIDLSDDDHEVVELMIRYFYTNQLVTPASAIKTSPPTVTISGVAAPPIVDIAPPVDTSSSLLLYTQVYIMADRFAVPDLKVEAKHKYQLALPSGWNSEAFSKSLVMMWDNTMPEDRMLKDVAIDHAGRHAVELIDRGDFVAAIKGNTDLAFEFAKATVECRKAVPVVKTAGVCSAYGLSHSNFVVTGRRSKYYCKACSVGWD